MQHSLIPDNAPLTLTKLFEQTIASKMYPFQQRRYCIQTLYKIGLPACYCTNSSAICS